MSKPRKTLAWQMFHSFEKFLIVLVQQPKVIPVLHATSSKNIDSASLCPGVKHIKIHVLRNSLFGLLPQLHLTTCIAHIHFLLRFKELCSMCAWILSF